ncbi:hypothetical protein LXA47_13880 [Massilia sp. P8910]|uniref:hypothetical protein n=1 Tax=Massilia antarctica TaxID=2765360 RepID=UPI0006BC10A9|nr:MULTISPECIES: hypothetical protein [Massilia]MCE3604690.1 hypothetical protein [Massilia antarctica]MCY0912237.1 hypothetical protein [Massilia sp. H27-R4]CUI06268.1 hypothetical protein BN2497_7313 [Janthinobacterium sp. CG23_2]CUU30054.1 hypothetical protein BN3177_7313 [Janthinobacterium sp. CG23_2]
MQVSYNGQHMKYRGKEERKAYGMFRMVKAIDRAIDSPSGEEKARAARWASAWGAISGIRSRGMRLRRTHLFQQRPRSKTPSNA